jgi:hypothetical protein
LETNNEWRFDEHGGLQGINQVDANGVRIPIDIEHLLLFRTTPAPANSPEGWPILRGVYEAYYYASNISEIEGIGVERDLAGLPVIYLGADCTLGSDAKSDYTLAKDLVRNIRRDEQEGIVIPKAKMGQGAGEGRGMLLELLSSAGARQFDTSEIINRWDRRKAMAVLAQFIMLGMEKVGSYSLGRAQSEYFSLAVGAWAGAIAETVNRHAVPRLFARNTFTLDDLPLLDHSEVGVPDLEGLGRYVNQLVGVQVLTPDDNLEAYLREAAQLPPMPEEITVREQTPEQEEAEKGGWLRAEYVRWLTGDAHRMIEGATADERLDILGKSIVRLAKALGQPAPVFDLEAMSHGAEYIVTDGMLTAVARKLAVLALDDDLTVGGVVAAGNVLLRRFADLRPVERDAIQKAIVKRQEEDDVAAMVAALEVG